MGKLDQNEQIRQLAYDLKIPSWNHEPIEGIIDYCLDQIQTAIPRNAKSIDDVEKAICKKLSLKIVEIWNDNDLAKIVKKYVALGEYVLADLPRRLDNNWTFAELLRLQRTSSNTPDLWLAIIDCRGSEKAHRRFFTRWHEIAHLLTLTPQMNLRLESIFNRSSNEKCPIESLMDIVAGEVAFYDPLFLPILKSELLKHGRPSFRMIEDVRNRFRPEASFHCTALAVVKRLSIPVIFVEAKLGLKKNEATRESIRIGDPKPKLRATAVCANKAARKAGLRISPNMRVPKSSIVFKTFRKNNVTETSSASEELDTWTHSDGTALPERQVHIETRGGDGFVYALLTLSNLTEV